jgi:hypothetical protein
MGKMLMVVGVALGIRDGKRRDYRRFDRVVVRIPVGSDSNPRERDRGGVSRGTFGGIVVVLVGVLVMERMDRRIVVLESMLLLMLLLLMRISD